MEDFIVRIYRRKERNGELFGVVEEVGVEGRKAFRTMGELVRILRGDPAGDGRKAEGARLAVPAIVEGNDLSGGPFREETVIEELTSQGARLRLTARVLEGYGLQLRILPGCFGVRRRGRVASVARGPAPRLVGVVFE